MRKRQNKMGWWCKFGLHRWSGPGFECEECGYPDTLFDSPEIATKRMEEWRASRSRP